MTGPGRCAVGHALEGINLRIDLLRQGRKGCRVCEETRRQARWMVKKAGGMKPEQRQAARDAVANLDGTETPASIGLRPFEIHFRLGLVDDQLGFNDDQSAR